MVKVQNYENKVEIVIHYMEHSALKQVSQASKLGQKWLGLLTDHHWDLNGFSLRNHRQNVAVHQERRLKLVDQVILLNGSKEIVELGNLVKGLQSLGRRWRLWNRGEFDFGNFGFGFLSGRLFKFEGVLGTDSAFSSRLL